MNWFVKWAICLSVLLLVAPVQSSQQESGEKTQPGDDAPDGLKALKHPNPQIRYNAIDLLIRLGKNAKFAAPHLRDLLKDPHPSVRIKAAEALWKIEQPAPGPLLTVLTEAAKEEEEGFRTAALAVLTEMGEKAKPALPTVKKGLKDKAFAVKLQAIRAAGAMGPAAKSAVPELLNIILDDDTGFLEAQVALALGKIGSAAVPSLCAALSNESAKVRRGSAFALGLIGPKAYEAVPDLTKALKDDEPLVRALSAESLGKIGQEAEPATPALTKALKDDDADVRINSAVALWRIGKHAAGIDVLAAAVTQSQGPSRKAAVAALGQVGAAAKPALPALVKALGDKDAEVRLESVKTLGILGPLAKGTGAKITPLLHDKSVPVRLHAVHAIWKTEKKISKKGIEILEQALDEEEMDHLLLATRILGDIGPDARDVVPALLPFLHHKNKVIRAAVLDAVQKIDPKAVSKPGNP
jgi:HEAT repeat protein